MNDHSKMLRMHLSAAYSERVLRRGAGSLDVLTDALAADASLKAHAQSEAARMSRVSDQCFVSKVSAEFLKDALRAVEQRDVAGGRHG